MIRNLQSLRFVFSFSILISHFLGHEYSTFGLGEYGVAGFFILSGFVLSVAYGRKIENGQFQTWPFFCKQWAKLYPLHLATFIIAIFYEAYYGRFYEWYQLLPPVFLVQSWIPDESFHFIPNGSSWSLCGFFFFYLLFSMLFVWLNRLPLRRLLAGIVLGMALYVMIALCLPERMVYAFLYTSPLMRLPDFVIGIILYRLLRSDAGEQIKERITACPSPLLTAIETLVLVAPVVAFLGYDAAHPALRCVSLFWLFVAAQLLLFSWTDSASGLVTRLFHSRPVMFLGGISFEIYLIHMFVVPSARSVASRLGLDPISPVALLAAAVLSVLLSYMAKRYFVDKTFAYLKPYL